MFVMAHSVLAKALFVDLSSSYVILLSIKPSMGLLIYDMDFSSLIQ